MRQATSTLKQFSDKDQDYHAYQARQNYLREQLTIQHEIDEERKAKDEAVKEKEAALKEKEEALKDRATALAEIEQLKALLAKNNLH